jgi:hypothetical protein
MPLASLFSSKKPQETATMPDEQAQQPSPQLDELVAQLANQEQATTLLQTQLTDAVARAEQAEAALVGYQASAKESARKAQLSTVLADDKVGVIYASTSSLDDASFATIVASYASNVAATEDGFKELGSVAADEPAKDFTTQMMALTANALNKGKK